MAANKFATMLNKNTNKITLVLVYAVLEWVLILLLLLNSLFSYLIIKFADYFGLKRPCLWCSRLDRFFEPKNFHNSYRSLVCEAHAIEISQLDYCFTHKKLAESQGMCRDCSPSSPRNGLFSDKFAFFPWMKQLGLVQGCKDGADKESGNGEANLECSCCGVSLEKKLLFRDYDQLNGFWEDSDYTREGKLVLEGEAGDRFDEVDNFDWNKPGVTSDHVEEENKIDESRGVEIGNREHEAEENKVSSFVSDFKEMLDNICDGLAKVVEEEKEPVKRDDLDVPVDDRVVGQNVAVQIGNDGCCESQPRHLEFFIDQKDCHLIPIELVECNDTQEKLVLNRPEKNEEDFVFEFDKDVDAQYELVLEEVDDFEDEVPLLSVHETEEQPKPAERFPVVHTGKVLAEEGIECNDAQEKQVFNRPEKNEEDFVFEFDKHVGTQYELIVEAVEDFEEEVPLLLVHKTEEQPESAERFSVVHTGKVLAEEGIECNDAQEKQVLNRPEKNDEDFVFEFDKDVGTQYELVVEAVEDFEEEMPLLSVHKTEKQPEPAERFSVVHTGKVFAEEGIEQVAISQATQTPTTDGNDMEEISVQAGEEMEPHNTAVSEELLQMPSEELETDVSLRTEVPDQEPICDSLIPEVSHLDSSLQEHPSTSNASYCAYGDHEGSEEAEEHPVEFRTIAIEMNELAINNHLPPISESSEIEEDAVPDTPTSTDALHHIHGKLPMLERKESGPEESLDGSVISDIEAGDGVSTIEKLKSALRAERKALNALYMELEEEWNASEVAANQTMAMINRLQEEKAAMHMEALQYQRMMEEQSEYDQETLQLLNDLMVKREREKDELEKELEVYREKVKDCEAREKMMMLKRSKDGSTRSGNSSASCSNSEDDDGQSVDLNHEQKEEDSFIVDHQEISNQNTPVDAVLHLEESLANFEEERLSILEQLKVLEEKLFMLSDGEEQHFEDIKPIELLYKVNGNGYHEEFDHSGETNGVANGHYKEMNGTHHRERKIIGAKAKRLLPFFDAINLEAEDGMLNGYTEMEDGPVNGQVEGFHSVGMQKSVNKLDSDDKKLAVEEEVDHVYERLQALEADGEFLKHCITSLRKGDKGIELLQEILQHLRDLRSVEFRVRNSGDGLFAL